MREKFLMLTRRSPRPSGCSTLQRLEESSLEWLGA